MDVSIIIVNYNTKDVTTNCINSVIQHTHNLTFEIILVDNASRDGSIEYFRTRRDISFIESNVNLGFGKANNWGITHAKGEFLLLLNSDTLLIENSIQKLKDFFVEFEEKLNIGVLGTLLVDNQLKINGFGDNFPTCKIEIHKKIASLPIIGKFLTTTSKQTVDIKQPYFEIDYVVGADMFLRKDLFDNVQGFYEGFFMYYEESDLQKRINEKGYLQYIYTGTRIIHLEEASGNSIKNYSNKKRIIAHQSRNTYLKRNDINFSLYVLLDFAFILLNFFNFKYSLKENLIYCREIIKTY